MALFFYEQIFIASCQKINKSPEIKIDLFQLCRSIIYTVYIARISIYQLIDIIILPVYNIYIYINIMRVFNRIYIYISICMPPAGPEVLGYFRSYKHILYRTYRGDHTGRPGGGIIPVPVLSKKSFRI